MEINLTCSTCAGVTCASVGLFAFNSLTSLLVLPFGRDHSVLQSAILVHFARLSLPLFTGQQAANLNCKLLTIRLTVAILNLLLIEIYLTIKSA